MRGQILLGLCCLFCSSLILAQDQDGKLSSGPQVGKFLPAAFDCLIINGKNKGRQHCVVCAQGLNPAVLVFAREPAEGKDGPLTALMAKLEEALERHQEAFLGGAVVFLSPAAKNSANNDKEEDPDKLVEEAKTRDELVKRLTARTEKLKNLVVGCFPPEGPKDYKINPKAEVTILIYERHKVLANYAFAEGKMAEADADRIIAAVDNAIKKTESK
jgi:hypothetical protein